MNFRGGGRVMNPCTAEVYAKEDVRIDLIDSGLTLGYGVVATLIIICSCGTTVNISRNRTWTKMT